VPQTNKRCLLVLLAGLFFTLCAVEFGPGQLLTHVHQSSNSIIWY